MTKFIQVITTTDKRSNSIKITNALLKKRLAACIHVTQIDSRYWWKGKIVRGKEYLIAIKTKKSLYTKVEKEIKANHDYKIPEIVAIPILNGNKDYLNWIEKETK